MFLFVVPFKCRERCADWTTASFLCRQAVRSMLAGGDEVKVILVCHDVPEGLPEDSRLMIHRLNTPQPRTPQEMMEDKYLKIKAGLVLAREFAPAWLMRADADDLVSRRLVPFIASQKSGTAWYAETGWSHRPGSRWAVKLADFHRQCGTSCVTYATPDDLPASLAQPREDFILLTKGHHIIVDYLQEAGVPTFPVPFPTTIYMTDSGENWSGSSAQSRRLLLKKLLNSRPLTAEIRREFGLETR